MIFYVLLVVVALGLFLISYKYPSTEKAIGLMFLVIMVIIGGFRDRIGADYDSYTNWYLKGTRDDSFEFGFVAIMKVFRCLNLDYHFLFFFFSFFSYLFVYFGIKKYTDKSTLPLFLFFLIPVLFIFSFNGIRQFLSVTIAFYAFSYLLEKKYISFFLLMLVGVSIHYSCLFPFVVFLIVFKWGCFIKIHHLYLLMVFTFIIGQIGIIHWLSFLFKDSHYLYYVSENRSVAVPLSKLVVMNTMFFLVINYYDKKGFRYSNQKYLLLIYVCSVLFLNLFSESVDLTRLYIYFRIFEIILVTEIIYAALKNKRFWFIGFVCCFYIFPYFRAINFDYENGPKILKLIPYKTLLLKNVPFED